MPELFAAGAQCINGTECPVAASGIGFGESRALEVAAKKYDDRVGADKESPKRVPEAEAEEAWAEVIHDLQRWGQNQRAAVVKEVADELGWGW